MVGMGAQLVKTGWIVLGVVAMIMFGGIIWLYRDKLKDAKALMMVAITLLLIPIGAKLVLDRTNLFPRADVEIRVVDTQVQKKGNSAIVYLTLSEPAVAYMEFKDLEFGKMQIIIAGGKVEKRIGHTFEIKDVGKLGGEMVFVINERKSKPVVIQ